MKSKKSKVSETDDRSSYFNRWWVIVIIGGIIRLSLHLGGLHDVLQRRVEIVNPVSSWYRMKECMALKRLNISPYSGDICHQPPLVISFFEVIPEQYTSALFILIDLLAGFVFYKFAKSFIKNQVKNEEENKTAYAKGIGSLLISNVKKAPEAVIAMYLLSPFTVVNCLAYSSTSLSNLVVGLALLAMSSGWLVPASLFVSVLTYTSLYPVLLLIPILLCALKAGKGHNVIWKMSQCVSTFTVSLYMLLKLSAHVFNSWGFLSAVYGFVLEAPDLTPNMGLFWYLFLEMFDHFRLFFLCVYQINVFVYAIPLAVVFRKHPYMVFYALLSLMALFKSYSNFGDLSAPIAMLPLWSIVYKYMRNFLLVAGMFFFTVILAPLMWMIWIYSGAGNANFYYAVTLAYCTAQVFLLSDVLYAFLRREYHLRVGLTPKNEKGEVGQIVMK